MIKSNFRRWTGRGLIYILTANPFLNSCTLETTEIYKLKEDIEYTNYNEHQIKLKEHQVKSHMKRTTNYKNELEMARNILIHFCIQQKAFIKAVENKLNHLPILKTEDVLLKIESPIETKKQKSE